MSQPRHPYTLAALVVDLNSPLGDVTDDDEPLYLAGAAGPDVPLLATDYDAAGQALLATEAEAEHWGAAYTALEQSVEAAQKELDAATDAFQAARERCTRAVREAKAAYAPVQEEIDARRAEMVAEAEAKWAAEQAAAAARAAAEQARLDAEQGPREWVVQLPRTQVYTFRADSQVPTVHRADCPAVRPESRAVRLGEAWAAVHAGARLKDRKDYGTRATGKAVPVRRCARCGADALLEQALGRMYTELRDAEEAGQQGAVKKDELLELLGNYGLPVERAEGALYYGLVGVRAELGEPEVAVGCIVDNTAHSDAVALGRLVEALPELGYVSRPLLSEYDGTELEYAVAVRAMTAAERRRYTALLGYEPGSRHRRPKVTPQQVHAMLAKRGLAMYEPPQGPGGAPVEGYAVSGWYANSAAARQVRPRVGVRWAAAGEYAPGADAAAYQELCRTRAQELVAAVADSGYGVLYRNGTQVVFYRYTKAEKEALAAREAVARDPA